MLQSSTSTLAPCRHYAPVSVRASSSRSAVAFPRDYGDVILQAQAATKAALKDGCRLMEIEFPTASLDSVPGDAEGGIEMTNSMVLVNDYCRIFTSQPQPPCRIFFPDLAEVAAAKEKVFPPSSPLRLGYLTTPSGLSDLGFGNKSRVAERVAPDDSIFIIAYPHFNVNEMLAVGELYDQVASKEGQPIVVFNGELDRIRSGYYPAFFYPKLGALNKTLIPLFESIFYIHNFKGRFKGKLFRAYPGPWQVLREDRDGRLVCVHQSDKMPTLKEVALEILPKA